MNSHDSTFVLLDASSFITISDRTERQLRLIPRLLDKGTIRHWKSSRVVLEELRKKNDELAEFFEDHYPDRFPFPSLNEQNSLKKLLEKHPTIVDPEDPSIQADIFLIAEAITSNYPIAFSRDALASILFSKEKIKLMDKLRIRYLNVEDLLDAPN